MVASVISPQTQNLPPLNGKTNGSKPKPISWADFQKRFLSREDGFKYEWLNGEIVKSKHTDFTQFYIVVNLQRMFAKLIRLGKINGVLMPEGDIFFGPNHRRPDVAFLSDEQLARTAYGENQVPSFVIEIISTKDQMNLVHDKMGNYRQADVQVVWHIFPKIGEVHVYFGSGLKQMNVCIGDDVCSASPALPDFLMTAAEVFQKPPKPE